MRRYLSRNIYEEEHDNLVKHDYLLMRGNSSLITGARGHMATWARWENVINYLGIGE